MEENKKTSETPKNTWEGVEKFFATEVIEQSKRAAKRWFIAWIITFTALICTNLYWIYQFNSYDYVFQDGEGINNINTGEQGDLENGTESQN